MAKRRPLDLKSVDLTGLVERATIRLDLTTSRHVGMGHSLEAGYNLDWMLIMMAVSV